MRRKIISIIIVSLLFGLFAIQAQGLDGDLLEWYVYKNAITNENAVTNGNPGYKYLGGTRYWEEQINKGKWLGENRPEALMGDANIDGKVNATDALFALHFSVYGNIQTSIILANVRTPPQMDWESQLTYFYRKGT